MSAVTGARFDLAALRERAETASAQERANCIREIEGALATADGPAERADLLMCRALVLANQWETREVLQDALAAMALYEEAGAVDAVLNAASLGAGYAARLGELSLGVELAVRCILGMGSLTNETVRADVTNRLGMFCYAFFEYDRAVEQMEVSLQAAERCADARKIARELHNIVDTLLLAVRQDRASGEQSGRYDRHGNDRLAKASAALERLLTESSPEYQHLLGVQRPEAELLLELGQPDKALELLRQKAGETGLVNWAAGQSALAVIEARCLRALGRPGEAVTAARRATALAERCEEYPESMLALDELVAAERDAGYVAAALADAVELKRRMWVVHRGQTAQLIEQAWARAAVEHQRQALEAQTAAAIRSAEEDALTRVGNRRLLERVLGEVAQSDIQVALLMADIDHFKLINDTFGHEVGDHVLRALGRILASDARTGQVVVRYGGEEFVFALPSVDLGAARDFAERIRLKVLSYPWEDLEGRLGVTISIGVACGPAANWPSVLASADRALYLAKKRGRNRVEVPARVAKRTA